MTTSWIGITTLSLTTGALIAVLPHLSDAPSNEIAHAVDAIDASIPEGKSKQDLKIYGNYNDGGYLEFRGYHSYLDPRAEVFIKANNGKADVLEEWEDFQRNKIKLQDFLNKYNFDYLLVDSYDRQLYETQDNGYEVIYEYTEYGQNDTTNRGIKVYKKIETPDNQKT